jgi:hypothetical protein
MSNKKVVSAIPQYGGKILYVYDDGSQDLRDMSPAALEQKRKELDAEWLLKATLHPDKSKDTFWGEVKKVLRI